MRRLVLAMAAFALAACSEPYDPPSVFDENVANGVSTEAPAQSFAGLDDLAQLTSPDSGGPQSLRVLWTHGMCTPGGPRNPGDPYVWWQVRTNDLLAADPAARMGKPAEMTYLPNGSAIIKETLLVPSHTSSGMREMELWFFDWSPVSQKFKPLPPNDIEASPSNAYRYDRAKLNNSLKQGLMKDCMADVVVYLGHNGDLIRSDAQDAVCRLFDGTMTDAGCEGAGHTHYTAIISESLGSMILFDAFRTLQHDISAAHQSALDQLRANAPAFPAVKRGRVAPSPAMTAYQANLAAANAANLRASKNGVGMSAAVGSLTSFYMLANQLPLLDLAGPHGEALEGFAESRNAGAPALTVVAFLDPNDLLSFRLVPKTDRARVVNFVVSNTNTYLGYAELPTYAHCNYVRNGYVMHAIWFGYAGGRPQSSSVSDPEPCF